MPYQFKRIGFLLCYYLLLLSCGSTNGSNNANSNHMDDTTMTLLKAVSENKIELVKEILIKKPKIDQKDARGRTSLMIAAYDDNNIIAELLINAGADVNAQDDMLNSPFLFAGANGNLALVKMCLANGANFSIFNRYGGSALIPAAERRHLDVVNFLVNTPGYPIDHINSLGWTAMLEAIILGTDRKVQIEIVRSLIKGGSDVNIADNDGVTPLQHAKYKSLMQIVKMLTEAGAR